MSPHVVPSAMDTLREAMSRASEREGIPMIVALVDERGPMPAVTHTASLTTGVALAKRVDDTWNELAPSMRDGDNGGVVNALVVAAHDLTPVLQSAVPRSETSIVGSPAIDPTLEFLP